MSDNLADTRPWSFEDYRRHGQELVRQEIKKTQPSTERSRLLNHQEQGEILSKQAIVIRAQQRTIEAQAHTIAQLMADIEQYQDVIEMLIEGGE